MDETEYQKWYLMGWQYSHRDTATLDWPDARGYPDPFYDGYMDYGAGRTKWHSRDHDPATCGEH